MKKFLVAVVVGALAFTAPLTARAANLINYTVSGTLLPDIFSTRVFGLTSTSPFAISFTADQDQAASIFPNTVFNNVGVNFSDPAYLLSRSAITNLSATIGNKSWTINDFVSASSLSNGNYDVLVTGGVTSPTGIYFLLQAADGAAQIGSIACASTCIVNPTGTASATDGFGYLTDLRFSASPAAVPEPATWAMVILGLGAIGAALRLRGRKAFATLA